MTTDAITVSRVDRHIGRVTFPRVLRSEWIKLRSVRTTTWPNAIEIVLWIGITYLMASNFEASGNPLTPMEQADFIANTSTFGVLFGQIAAAVLGVLVISGEYTTGTIQATLTAVPRRLPVLLAKSVVVFTASFVVGMVSSLGAFAVAQLVLLGRGVSASLLDPTVFLPMIGAAFYLGAVSVFALGVGAITRNSAGGISAALGLTILLPILPMFLPSVSLDAVMPFVLMNAGLASFGMESFAGISPLETWQQLLVIVGWTVLALAVGAWVLNKRDT